MDYDNITIGTILSELELTRRNVNVYNNTLVGAPTGKTSLDGYPEFEIVSIIDALGSSMTLEQSLAKEGKLYKLIASGEDVTRKAVTIEVPAGRYIQVTSIEATLTERASNDAVAVLEVEFGGTRTDGVLIQGYNFNSLNPGFANFDIYADATITSPTDTLTLRRYSISSTNQTSDNATYKSKDLMIFGNPDNPLNLTLELSCPEVLTFMGIFVEISEVDEYGKII